MAASCRSRTDAILRRCRRSLRDPFLGLVLRSPTFHSLTYARERPGRSRKQQQDDQEHGSDQPSVDGFDGRRRDALRIVDENAAERLDPVSADAGDREPFERAVLRAVHPNRARHVDVRLIRAREVARPVPLRVPELEPVELHAFHEMSLVDLSFEPNELLETRKK